MISTIHGMNDLLCTAVTLKAPAERPVRRIQDDEQPEIQQKGWQGESRSPQLRTQQGPVLYQTIEAMKEAEDDINIQDIEFLGCAPLRPMVRDNQADSRRERTAPLKSVFSVTA
ncbi:hypothetical protein [Morganella morganii]|uniref:hypothetical protein n=1 Tax=Morganella morganii TaxID=582 RepID=UPI0021D33EC1|nr:hypothetical protein [Morganella morganii]MCU6376366.1 hypothetical protein [Morganella morganii]HEI9844702.1 hypothetical protein [Morganella morganii]